MPTSQSVMRIEELIHPKPLELYLTYNKQSISFRCCYSLLPRFCKLGSFYGIVGILSILQFHYALMLSKTRVSTTCISLPLPFLETYDPVRLLSPFLFWGTTLPAQFGPNPNLGKPNFPTVLCYYLRCY